jgi:nicotinamide riboside kinase
MDGPGRSVRRALIVKRVLITGMSGAGKSSLVDELAARGHRAVDTDYGDYFHTVDGGGPVARGPDQRPPGQRFR